MANPIRIATCLFVTFLLICGVAVAQQPEVSYSDDFQSYGSPRNPPGWVDTAIGSSTPVADGLFKTWPDPLQGSKAANIAFGSKSASGRPEGNNPRMGHFSTLSTKNFSTSGRFEYRGRFLRTTTDSRIGFTFLSGYPEKDQYYLIGLWSVPNSQAVTMQLFGFGAGTITGTTNSNFTPDANKWYRFLIQVDEAGGATKIRARFWPDGSTEPTTFSIDAQDAAATRLTSGRIGLWAAIKGANYFDDLFAKSPVDHTAPVITFYEAGVLLPPNTTTNLNHPARVDIRATDDLSGVATITATADGQPYTPLTPISAEGTHVIHARAVDYVGNASESETSVLVDLTPPVIAVSAFDAPLPLPVARFNRIPSLAITATDAWTGATFKATLDNQPYTPGTPLTEGTHHLVVDAVDGVKNASRYEAEILVDLGPPVIEFYEKGVKLSSPAKFRYAPSIELRLTDPHSQATYTASLENGTAWKSLDPMPTGWHKITVNAVDEAGNTSTATLDVLVDLDAPVIVLKEGTNTLDPSVTAKYNRDVAIDISITDATSQIASSATLLNGQAYVSGTLITVERNTHALTVRAEDEAGNVTEVALAILLDKTAPVIAFASGERLLDARQLEKFRTDAKIDISVTDAVSGSTYTATLTTPVRSTTVPFTSGSLVTDENTHEIKVSAVDDAGNTAESTLKILVDKTAPSIAFAESGTPLDTTKETPFGRDVRVDITVTDNLPGVTYTATLDGTPYTSGDAITADGPHTVAVHAIDAAENPKDAEVKVLVDKTGPVIQFFENNVELVPNKRHDFNRLPSIEIRVSDALSTVESVIRLDDQPYTSNTPVSEGYRTITVRATDARGNVTDAKLDLLVDATAPVVKLVDKTTGNELPATGAIFARDVTVDAQITDISKTTTAA
ncbi:MAG: OmpL47-type beta-barrel domain-containing protein, partial [Thermoanaerobaculia bacterium]